MPSLATLFGATVRVKLPPEFADEAALLRYLGLSPAELRKIWWFRHRMYRHFNVAKASGKVRTISAPDRRLKMLQRKVATSLYAIYRPRSSVHGFVFNRSIKTNAASHLKSKFVINLDLTNFFPSITEHRVVGLFEALGISKRVAEILARVCCNQGALTQGAPSSPIISNMICFRLDKQLQAYAKRTRCIYTRYADDISFSSYQPPADLFEGALPASGKFSPDLLDAKLRTIIGDNGFSINPSKAHYADRYSRRTVTGLRINELINLDRRFVRNVRAALFAVEKHGAAAAQQTLRDKYSILSDIGSHLQGRISWIGHVKGRSDPLFRTLVRRYNRQFPKTPLEVLPTQAEIRDRAVWVLEPLTDDLEELEYQGTAFFLKSVGLVTAWHCVENSSEFELHHPTKRSNKFKARVRSYDAHRDLAILEHNIPSDAFFELEVCRRAPETGDSVMAAGYPAYGPGDRINIRPGTVSSLAIQHGVSLIEVTQKLAQGMSGGPVIDARNQVAGIIHKGGPTEGRDFAVHIQVLVDWLKESEATCACDQRALPERVRPRV